MKRLFIYIIAAAAVLSACSEKIGAEFSDAGIVLKLDVAAPATKATEAGVDALNENLINSLNWFICDGETAEAAILAAGSVSLNKKVTTETVALSIQESEFKSYFASAGDTRTLIVLANASSLQSSQPATVQDILNLGITLQNNGARQDAFVMMGMGTATRKSGTKLIAEADVQLKRSLSKLRIKLDVSKFADYAGNVRQTVSANPANCTRYTADMSHVDVIFHNAASKGNIVGTAVSDQGLFNYTERTCTTADQGMRFNASHTDPYYSCPRTWAIGDDEEAYFMVVVPWSSVDYDQNGTVKAGSQKPATATYYKILLKGTSFECNTIYDISVKLEGCGSFIESAPVTVEDINLEIADWHEANLFGNVNADTEARFEDARVLDIPETSVTVYNSNTASIPYYTSHACSVEKITLQHMKFNSSGDPETTTINYTTAAQINALVTLSENIESQNNRINFSHNLNNDLSSNNLDYSEYTYTIRIKHSDDNSGIYYDEVVLHQIPAITVMNFPNSTGLKNSATTFVNGKKAGESIDFGSLTGNISNSNNSNNNMYVMTVSKLSNYYLSGTQTLVVVGDPRKSTIDLVGLTSGNTQATNTNAIIEGPRQIRYYYPSDENLNNVIAPKFRIASSHGLTEKMSRATAMKRCATYQEDGYPAGRWRIPTRAEIEFIATMSSRRVIPKLFGSSSGTSYYWCANGIVGVNSSGGTAFDSDDGSTHYVRCVYDEWYWENTNHPTVNKNTFTWGDMPR